MHCKIKDVKMELKVRLYISHLKVKIMLQLAVQFQELLNTDSIGKTTCHVKSVQLKFFCLQVLRMKT